MKQDAKLRNALSAFILILIVVIYTFYRMNHADMVSVSVGVDDSKIGIAADDEREPVFISLKDVQKVDFTEDFNVADYPDCTVFANEDLEAFVVVTTLDMVYVINTSTENATKNVYNEIVDAISQ